MNSEIIPIFYACCDRTAPAAVDSITSLIRNASETRVYRIHVLQTDLGEEQASALRALQRKNVEICIEDMKQESDSIKDSLPTPGYDGNVAYSVLFLANRFGQYQKAVWLDCSTEVRCDVGELYRIPLGIRSLQRYKLQVQRLVNGFVPLYLYL